MVPRLLIEIFDAGGALGPERFPDSARWERPYLHEDGSHEKIGHMVIPIYRIESPDAQGGQFLDE